MMLWRLSECWEMQADCAAERIALSAGNQSYSLLSGRAGLGVSLKRTRDAPASPKHNLIVSRSKSFCHEGDLDNVSPTSLSDCSRLKQQIGILKGWIEARSQENVPLVVLGDFNRRFNVPDDDMWRELDDGNPDLA
jgi:hypothetical protein